MTWRLSEAADRDIENIYIEGARQFGLLHADHYHVDLIRVFDLLAQFPDAERERAGLFPPARVHPHKAHVILYAKETDGILILCIRHGRENWTED